MSSWPQIQRATGSMLWRAAAVTSYRRTRCNLTLIFLRNSTFHCIHQYHTHQFQWRLLSSIPQLNEDEPDVTCNDVDEYLSDDSSTDELVSSRNELSKGERRQLHAENARLAEQRKELNRRKLLSEEWMRLFASCDELFRATLLELNVKKGEWGSKVDRSDEDDSALAEYKSFYLDSLNSFGTALAEKDAESDISQASFQSLDGFERSLFGDESFSASYRSTARQLKRREHLKRSMENLTKRYSRATKDFEDEEILLRQIKGEQDSKPDNRRDFDELGDIENAMNAALLNTLQADPKSIEKQENRVENGRLYVNSLKKRIDTIQSEIDAIDLPLSEVEYMDATEQLIQVSSILIPDLAKYITNRHADFEKLVLLEQHTDLTKPHQWYPRARLDKRKVIFHAGPTNSGKTYQALQRLKQANKGMYLAPLRLLAAECYENLTADGIYCNLLTGQEKREVAFSTHRSSTVEMADLDQDYDVVVIDEIQMIGDSFRGFAWTRALMGVRCKEIHLAGGLEARIIVEKICRMCEDDLEVKTYERFGELHVQENSLAPSSSARGSYSNVQPGDCIVAFTRPDIFAIKKEIESSTPFKCCLIYGTLPPEIRAEQARLFNDPNSQYDILVASDAIGMGLNLSIKRIVFNSLFKHNGEEIVRIDHSLVKQIAGRAGRRNSPYPHGEVTCRDPIDMKYLRQCMSTEIKPIGKAGLVPTPSHIQTFDDILKQYDLNRSNSLHKTLKKFSDMATVQGDFFICRKQASLKISEKFISDLPYFISVLTLSQTLEAVSSWLKDVEGMTTAEKFNLCMSPVKENCSRSKGVLMRYVEKHSAGKSPGIHRSMCPREAKTFHGLSELCSVYQELDLFLWLQTKLPSNAVESARAQKLREDTMEMINKALINSDKLSLEKFDYVYKDNRWRKLWAQNRRESKG